MKWGANELLHNMIIMIENSNLILSHRNRNRSTLGSFWVFCFILGCWIYLDELWILGILFILNPILLDLFILGRIGWYALELMSKVVYTSQDPNQIDQYLKYLQINTYPLVDLPIWSRGYPWVARGNPWPRSSWPSSGAAPYPTSWSAWRTWIPAWRPRRCAAWSSTP